MKKTNKDFKIFKIKYYADNADNSKQARSRSEYITDFKIKLFEYITNTTFEELLFSEYYKNATIPSFDMLIGKMIENNVYLIDGEGYTKLFIPKNRTDIIEFVESKLKSYSLPYKIMTRIYSDFDMYDRAYKL